MRLTSCALTDLDHLTTSLLKTMTLDANPIEGPFFSLFQWHALELNTEDLRYASKTSTALK